MKNQYVGGLPKKGELRKFCRFKGDLARKRGAFFRGVIPNAHYA